jgi:hypothetical protein
MPQRVWPPEYFAVLQDGNGEAPYFRAAETDESAEVFAERIGQLVARDIEYQGTTFVDVINGQSGESSAEVTSQVLVAIATHKALRREARSCLEEI